jgi:hypothetical protein
MARLAVLGAVFLAALALFPCAGARADDAGVLPKGLVNVSLEGLFYVPIKEKFNADGDREPVAFDLDNRALDNQIFPALGGVLPFFPALGGTASIGDSDVSYTYDLQIVNLALFYGLTDRITVGVNVPYWWMTNLVRAQLKSGAGSSANVGLNPNFGVAGHPLRLLPVIPLTLGGQRLSTEDVQQLLGPGLPGISGFGFDRVKTWRQEGFADLDTGAKIQFLKTDDVRMAGSLGMRFPTGEEDDPDSLVDFPFGDGVFAILLRLHGDYLISNLWNRPPPVAPGAIRLGAPGDFQLNLTFRYNISLPDRPERRVPSDVNNPITTNKERVSRDMGDRFEAEFGLRYQLFQDFSVSGWYRFVDEQQDEINGTKGFAYSVLEKESAVREHVFFAGATYSTTRLYLAKEFPFPMTVTVGFRDRFAGKNNTLASQYLYLQLGVFF